MGWAKRGRQIVVGALLGSLALSSGGCSFLFVEDPKPVVAPHDPTTYSRRCTTSAAWPTVDVLIALYQVVRTVVAFERSEDAYRGQVLSRGADIGFGLSLTGLFTASAIFGGTAVSECSSLRAKNGDEGDEDDEAAPRPHRRFKPGELVGAPMPPPLAPRNAAPAAPAPGAPTPYEPPASAVPDAEGPESSPPPPAPPSAPRAPASPQRSDDE